MIKCESCGNEIKEGYRYCTKCGKHINDNITNDCVNKESEGIEIISDYNNKYNKSTLSINRKIKIIIVIAIIIISLLILPVGKLRLKNVLNGQWNNGEQEWALKYGLTFSEGNGVKYEGYRIQYNGTYSISSANEILIHFDNNTASWAGTGTEVLAVVDVKGIYDYKTKTLSAFVERKYDDKEVYFEDDAFKKENYTLYNDY